MKAKYQSMRFYNYEIRATKYWRNKILQIFYCIRVSTYNFSAVPRRMGLPFKKFQPNVRNYNKRIKKHGAKANAFLKKEEEVNRKLPQLKKRSEKSDDIYKEVYNAAYQPSRLYGTPKSA